jgi:mRNA interferase MazF
MRRGEIRLVDLEPVRGAEADKRRPAIIVSKGEPDGGAARARLLTVVPVTSNTERVHPVQVLLPAAETGLDRDAKAQAEQVRSVAVERIGARVGVVPPELAAELDEALRLHLAL